MDVFLEKIGADLRHERKSMRFSQAIAANKAGLSRREISEIENGIFRGSVLKVQNYAMLFGLSLVLEKKRFPLLAELPKLFDEE